MKKKELQERLDNIVFCEDCGVAIKKDRANKTIRTYTGSIGYDEKITLYYCQTHKKNYDIECSSYRLGVPSHYFKNVVEVDKNGKVINKSKK